MFGYVLINKEELKFKEYVQGNSFTKVGPPWDFLA